MKKTVNMSEKLQIFFEYLGVLLGICGISCYFLGTFKEDLSYTFFFYGFVCLAISSYFVYKFIERTTKTKQVLGGIWIAIVVSFLSFHIVQLFVDLEEFFVLERFQIVRGQIGKQSLNTGSGYAEQFAPPPTARRDIRIIGIKTQTIDSFKGEWPLHWKHYAKVINLFQNPSNLLFIDIFFIDPKPGQVELITEAVKGKPNVLVDYPIETDISSKNTLEDLSLRHKFLRRFKLKNVVDEEGEAWLALAIPPVPSISANVGGLGFANIKREKDKPNRKMPLVAKLPKHGPKLETEYFPSIDLLTVAKYYGIDVVEDTEVVMGKYVKIKNIPEKKVFDPVLGIERDIMVKPNPQREITIPIDEYGQMEINFAGSLFCFQDEDLYEVATEWDVDTVSSFQNNIFLLAMYYATGSGTAKDTHPSPYGDMSGIEHHAHALNTILNQDFLSKTSLFQEILIILTLALILSFIQTRFQVYMSFLVFALLILSYTVLAFYVFGKYNFFLPQASVYLSLSLTFVTIIGFKILTEEENVKYIRNTFSKFVSKDVVDELLKDPDKIALGGARREITVFFSDVRGFTTLSESLSPEELVQLLNEYLSVMTDIIIQMRGTIDKYMGDAIMAFWGAPVPLEDHAYLACVTALKQIEQLKLLQESWKSRNLPTIDIGIGLNSGPAVVGNMGSSHRMDYTCMGDTVNLGSRLEGSNKLYGTRIIISEYTYEKVKDKVYARELDLVRVKGKIHPVRIYELLGLKQEFKMEDLKNIK